MNLRQFRFVQEAARYKLHLTEAAKALVEALKKAGSKPTRESVLQAMGNLGRLDLKGYTLTFGPNQRHGSNWVELTILSRGNRFVQ